MFNKTLKTYEKVSSTNSGTEEIHEGGGGEESLYFHFIFTYPLTFQKYLPKEGLKTRLKL